MPCTSYGSTSGVSIYWAIDVDDTAAISPTQVWEEVPFTSDSLLGKLTTAESNRITAARSYAGNAVVGGEVGGALGFEAEFCSFVTTAIKSALQSSADFADDGDSISNGSSTTCLMFLKRVVNGAGFDYYIYRGCQVDSMSMNVAPGSLIEGEINVMGVRMGADALGGTNVVLTQATVPVGWVLNSYTSVAIISSVFGLQGFSIQDSTPTDLGVIANSVSIEFSNSLRAQQGVGTGSPWPAGVASSRFRATVSTDAYYSGPEIFNAALANESLSCAFQILNSSGQGWSFSFPYVKPSDAAPPAADSPDQDLIVASEFMAYQSATGCAIVTLIDP